MSIESEIGEAIDSAMKMLSIRIEKTGVDADGDIGITIELLYYGSVVSTQHEYIRVRE